ncbi:MAG: SbcC/MukB-like Walker B domain-containing protein [Legionellaceae bacterium]|nr:SbcC/MukB-like Walker B domain-containing protein [Legionellaceae bacterium]
MNSGYRLVDLEVFNWGTFDGAIWHMALDGHGCLLTGENGTGKSTLIDAFLSLLVPNKRRSYNMSSGSERRERNETTYVRGAYQREKTRGDQIQVKYLRNEQSLSALVAHFANPLTKDRIALAQFFWFESGELRKCLVISHDVFSLKAILDQVKTPTDLRYNLRQLPHTTIFPSFSDYQDYFVRYMGVRSNKGMDLFNQVSTIKQIGNLNEFVRQNMLEETDMESLLDEFFHTFEDLTFAHQAIINARLQIESLDGIDKDARKFSETTLKLDQTTQLQTYLPRYFSAKQYEVLMQKQRELAHALAMHHENTQSVEQTIDHVQEKLATLTHSVDGKDRDERLKVIRRELHDTELMHKRCHGDRKKLEAVRTVLGLTASLTLENFIKEQSSLATMKSDIETNKLITSPQVFSLRQTEHKIQQQMQGLSEELLATQKNKTLMPYQYLELRRMLCEKLGLSPSDLPYAAELMSVKESEAKWRLAAEKLLRPLALKLLVPASYFMEANQILRSQNIGMKVVLQRIDLEQPYNTSPSEKDFLITKLEFLPRAKQSDWLKNHVCDQFSYQCVEDMQVFQASSRAITVEGLIKRHTHVSEKDDRAMSHAQYLLGWAHEDKVQRLTEESKGLKARLQEVKQELQHIEARELQGEQHIALLAQRQLFDSFDLVNTALWEKKLKTLEAQCESLMKQPETKEMNTLQQQLKILATDRDDALAQGAVIRNELEKIPGQLDRLSLLLHTFTTSEALNTELDRLITTLSNKEKETTALELEGRLAEILRANLARLAETKHHLGISLVRKMTGFKAKFPEVSIDMEASLDDLPSFLQRYNMLKKEDLPTHETRFKKLISKSVVTDLTAFKSTLELNAEHIKESIEHLNTSLKNIAYSDTSYVQIRMTKTKDTDIREFQAILRNAIQMKGLQQDELDLEESFQRIRSMITRLKNDMKWSSRVTDVRNWTDFFVVELAQEGDDEISFYSDSAGLSGGQKAKLAFTILASALAYQYGLNSETTLEKSFRFVVIDEAFSKSDDRNAQYALELFRKLGLQLLVVTPLDKLDIIKPYVQRIFVTQVARNAHRSQLAIIKTTAPSLAIETDG